MSEQATSFSHYLSDVEDDRLSEKGFCPSVILLLETAGDSRFTQANDDVAPDNASCLHLSSCTPAFSVTRLAKVLFILSPLIAFFQDPTCWQHVSLFILHSQLQSTDEVAVGWSITTSLVLSLKNETKKDRKHFLATYFDWTRIGRGWITGRTSPYHYA
jgi:hypothetical protein